MWQWWWHVKEKMIEDFKKRKEGVDLGKYESDDDENTDKTRGI